MRITGEWFPCPDNVIRPVIEADVYGADGSVYREHFLVDCGADRTVFSAVVPTALQLPVSAATPGVALAGISGLSPYVVVETILEFLRDDGGRARVRGTFAAFTDPSATDMSILGRDVLDNFDVILSRRRNEVLLLAPNHQYQVSGG